MLRRWRLFYIRPRLGCIKGERADRAKVKSGTEEKVTVFILQLLKTAIQRDVARCPRAMLDCRKLYSLPPELPDRVLPLLRA